MASTRAQGETQALRAMPAAASARSRRSDRPRCATDHSSHEISAHNIWYMYQCTGKPFDKIMFVIDRWCQSLILPTVLTSHRKTEARQIGQFTIVQSFGYSFKKLIMVPNGLKII